MEISIWFMFGFVRSLLKEKKSDNAVCEMERQSYRKWKENIVFKLFTFHIQCGCGGARE